MGSLASKAAPYQEMPHRLPGRKQTAACSAKVNRSNRQPWSGIGKSEGQFFFRLPKGQNLNLKDWPYSILSADLQRMDRDLSGRLRRWQDFRDGLGKCDLPLGATVVSSCLVTMVLHNTFLFWPAIHFCLHTNMTNCLEEEAAFTPSNLT